jgi:hypothetical protein
MQEYETRLTNGGTLSLLAIERYFNDADAIDAAKTVRKNGEKIEIWRDDVCIYAETSR